MCHYPGILRPSRYLPVPPCISPPQCTAHDQTTFLCPGSAWDDLQRSRGRQPTDTLFDTTFGLDPALATKTVGWLQELDCDEDVFIIIAHDSAVRKTAPHFPRTLNDWKSEGLGSKLKWAFLNDLASYWKPKGLAQETGGDSQ